LIVASRRAGSGRGSVVGRSRERFHELLKWTGTGPPGRGSGAITTDATIEMLHGKTREIPRTMGNRRPSRIVKI
jgi:hypothetical protein